MFFAGDATTKIYTLSLHDALPISWNAALTTSTTANTAPNISAWRRLTGLSSSGAAAFELRMPSQPRSGSARSEEHTSELQSRLHLVCRLLLEKKKRRQAPRPIAHR